MGRDSLNRMNSGNMEEYKEAAGRVANRVKEGAGEMGNKLYEKSGEMKAAAMDWFGQFAQK